MIIEPNFWCIIKVESEDPHYRVFGTWTGSYLTGSSWRMNSGVTRVVEDGDYYEFHGSSGSIYKCHKHMYGCHWESQGELNRYLTYDSVKGKYSLMDENTDWMNMDWVLGNDNQV